MPRRPPGDCRVTVLLQLERVPLSTMALHSRLSSRVRTLSGHTLPSAYTWAVLDVAGCRVRRQSLANGHYAEIDRVAENMLKSGARFPGGGGYPPMAPSMGGRRESMPLMGPRPYSELGTERHLTHRVGF